MVLMMEERQGKGDKFEKNLDPEERD